MTKYIDPPSGWKYGFPKPIPNDVTDINKWLVQNGYPQSEIESLGEYFFVRFFEKSDELNNQPAQEVSNVNPETPKESHRPCPFDAMPKEMIEFLLLCRSRNFEKLTENGIIIHDFSVMYDTYHRLIAYLYEDSNWRNYEPLVSGCTNYADMLQRICESKLINK